MTVLEQPDERNSQPLRFGSFGSRELPKRSGCFRIFVTMQNVLVNNGAITHVPPALTFITALYPQKTRVCMCVFVFVFVS